MSNEIKLTFKDAKCPVFFADGPVVTWSHGDGVVHLQFRAMHIVNPETKEFEVSPQLEVVVPFPVFFSLQDGVNGQAEQLKQQGVKRIPVAAAAPTGATGVGPKH